MEGGTGRVEGGGATGGTAAYDADVALYRLHVKGGGGGGVGGGGGGGGGGGIGGGGGGGGVSC